MKTVSNATFQFFCRKCRYWLKQFGVTDYTIQFAQEHSKGEYAAVEIDYEGRSLTFVLPYKLPNTARQSITHSAIHEVSHAVVAKLESVARDRHATSKSGSSRKSWASPFSSPTIWRGCGHSSTASCPKTSNILTQIRLKFLNDLVMIQGIFRG